MTRWFLGASEINVSDGQWRVYGCAQSRNFTAWEYLTRDKALGKGSWKQHSTRLHLMLYTCRPLPLGVRISDKTLRFSYYICCVCVWQMCRHVTHSRNEQKWLHLNRFGPSEVTSQHGQVNDIYWYCLWLIQIIARKSPCNVIHLLTRNGTWACREQPQPS